MLTHRTDLKETNDVNWEKYKVHLDAGLAGLRADFLKWIFVFSVLNVLTLGGLMIGFVVGGK